MQSVCIVNYSQLVFSQAEQQQQQLNTIIMIKDI